MIVWQQDISQINDILAQFFGDEQVHDALKNSKASYGDDSLMDRLRGSLVFPAGVARIQEMPTSWAERALGYKLGCTNVVSHLANCQQRLLGNTFCVFSIAYWLLPLKKMQDQGILPELNILSQCDGIGGCLESCLLLGLKVRILFTTETDKDAIRVARGSVQQARATWPNFEHVHCGDMTSLRVEHILQRAGGQLHLVIGGTPCGDVSRTNRHRGNGLIDTSKASFLVHHFARQLLEVAMHST